MPRLERILGSKTRVEVLRILTQAQKPMTGREIARLANATLKAVQLALKGLEEERVVVSRTLYGARPYSLNMNDPLVRQGLLPLFQLDRPVKENLAGALKAALDTPEIRDSVLAVTWCRTDSETNLKLLYVPKSSITDTSELEEKMRTATQHITHELQAQLDLQGVRYSGLREHIADPDFRRRAVDEGTPIVGPNLRTLII